MNCTETQHLLDAYLDGELDLVRNLEIDQHLQECPVCSAIYKNYLVLQSGMSSSELYYKAPADLQRRLQTSLRQTNQGNNFVSQVNISRRWVFAAASVAAAIVLAFGVLRIIPAYTADDLLTEEVVASHVRSLMVDHLEDVASTDQHTVKPWFDGKLDFSPQVTDLAAQGFPLIGGRLDYVDNKPVAALVYQRSKHYINLFIWPESVDNQTSSTTRQGYQVIHWSRLGMTYWAVSDVSFSDLQDFVQLIQNQTSPPATP